MVLMGLFRSCLNKSTGAHHEYAMCMRHIQWVVAWSDEVAETMPQQVDLYLWYTSLESEEVQYDESSMQAVIQASNA
jgi:hypothetical protein